MPGNSLSARWPRRAAAWGQMSRGMEREMEVSRLRVESFAVSLDGFGAGPELHIAIAPVILGSGECLFGGINLASLGYRCVGHVPTAHATHIVLKKG